MSKKRIIEAVAKVFADQKKAEMGINMGVILTMYDLNGRLRLPEVAIMTISLNLTEALKDCAKNKKIEIEKK